MNLSKKIEIPALPLFGLPPITADLPSSNLRRRVKIYKVPGNISSDHCYISVSDAGGIEAVPPSRSKDNVLLADYTLTSDNQTNINYIHKELSNA